MSLRSGYADIQAQSADALVEEHADLVKRIAAHLMGRLPPTVEMDDLVQVGLMALLGAARHYSPDKGANFATYAGIRVRGAMLDEVRSMGWAPRSVHRNQRRLTEAMREVENRKGGEAQPEEIAAAMDVSLDEYHQMVADAATGKLFSLDQMSEAGDPRAEIEGDLGKNPVDALEDDELREALAEQIGQLPEREAMVMALYYDEELNLKEIGKVLGVSESRVCQIHGQALTRLRARMEDWRERIAAA
ncbi:MAG: RNA polymerase sigma factor FliA [Gammaproteobacteria bacterium]